MLNEKRNKKKEEYEIRKIAQRETETIEKGSKEIDRNTWDLWTALNSGQKITEKEEKWEK